MVDITSIRCSRFGKSSWTPYSIYCSKNHLISNLISSNNHSHSCSVISLCGATDTKNLPTTTIVVEGKKEGFVVVAGTESLFLLACSLVGFPYFYYGNVSKRTEYVIQK